MSFFSCAQVVGLPKKGHRNLVQSSFSAIILGRNLDLCRFIALQMARKEAASAKVLQTANRRLEERCLELVRSALDGASYTYFQYLRKWNEHTTLQLSISCLLHFSIK